jgi:hypothetical protein
MPAGSLQQRTAADLLLYKNKMGSDIVRKGSGRPKAVCSEHKGYRHYVTTRERETDSDVAQKTNIIDKGDLKMTTASSWPGTKRN